MFTFLLNPQTVYYSYRQITGIAGLALRTANEAMSFLEEENNMLQVFNCHLILDNKSQLLENWIIGYQNVLEPSLLFGTFYFRKADNWRSIDLPSTAVQPENPLETFNRASKRRTLDCLYGRVKGRSAMEPGSGV